MQSKFSCDVCQEKHALKFIFSINLVLVLLGLRDLIVILACNKIPAVQLFHCLQCIASKYI